MVKETLTGPAHGLVWELKNSESKYGSYFVNLFITIGYTSV